MKKKILFIGLFLMAVAAVSVQSYSEKNKLGNLMLENIDALADSEWGDTAVCFGTGSVDCPINHVKVEFVMEGYSLERP